MVTWTSSSVVSGGRYVFQIGVSMKVYGDIQSGNCYKIKLLAGLLDIQHEWDPCQCPRGRHSDA